MNLEELTIYIDNKIAQDDKKIVIGFYELKVKKDLSDAEVLSALQLISTRLQNMGYKVYRSGQKYTYNGEECIVETNELLTAIK